MTTMTTTAHQGREESDMDFSTIPHGCLEEGTETDLGIIEHVSSTAYLIDGRWVPFARLHGPYRPAIQLGTFPDDMPTPW